MPLPPTAPTAASADDAEAILHLVAGSGLPLDGLAEQVSQAVVLRAPDGRVAGCALVEAYPPYGLLRSVAVDEPLRASGAGTALVAGALSRARESGLGEVFLLTETAPTFFSRLGFLPVARVNVPEAVKASPEFRSVCPASALVMSFPLATEPGPDGLTSRAARAVDVDAIAAIYNQGIEDRLATYETRARSTEDVKAWFNGRHPVVVVERLDGTGRPQIVAFASSSLYRTRDCYAGIAEFSVYAARADRGRGYGRLAMQALIAAAERAGFWKLLSRVFVENASSRRLLAGLGFREVGVYERHGQLDGVWRDVIITELLMGDARADAASKPVSSPPAPVR